MINLVLTAAFGYLSGSIATSVWVSKLFFKKDLRDYGSRNAGATNAYRVLGWKAALFVVLVDIGKGVVPTLFAARLFPIEGVNAIYLQLLAGVTAILGHCYTCFAGFRGGKGVGTAAGVLAVLYPIALPVCVVTFILTLAITRIVSLSSILAAMTLPVTQVVLIFGFGHSISWPLLWLGMALVPFILYTHRTNIARMINGTESRIGTKKNVEET
ncbi:MAG: glycerol-3-phosphate 1-O-acyltransferase PlsY [Acidobacteriota bacterium]|nr:glycerol-3-phosphate 1-O-acyltransferase PlsY [Acidobacteriota bacterium]